MLLKGGGITDFIITDDNQEQCFIVEVKNPKEDITNAQWKPQIKAYCSALEINLIVITNGIQFAIFDFNERVIFCKDIQELDLNFNRIEKLLHKRNQNLNLLSRISFVSSEVISNSKIHLGLTDFQTYLAKIANFDNHFSLFSENLIKITNYEIFSFKTLEGKIISFKEFIRLLLKSKNDLIYLKSDSGVGKTFLLRYLKSLFAQFVQKGQSDKIPIIIDLKSWTISENIESYILRLVGISRLGVRDIEYFLRKGYFIIFFDGYDELRLELRENFIKSLLKFNESYQGNRVLISMRSGVNIYEFEENRQMIFMEPPDLDDLIEHIEKNLEISAEDFLSEIKEKNLSDLARIPLFLNYLIILIKNNSLFPKSKYDIINNLIQNYFEKHIKHKFGNKLNKEVALNILSSIAYFMIWTLKNRKMTKLEYLQKLDMIVTDLKKSFEINESVGTSAISEFFISHNLVTFEGNSYSFEHQILADFFCAKKIILKINTGTIEIPFIELINQSNLHDTLVLSYPSIENEEYRLELLNNNIFLYIESILEQSNLEPKELELISTILLQKINSQFRQIREITWFLSKKFLKFLNSPEDFLFKMIEKTDKSSIISEALIELAKLKTDKSLNYLLNFNKFDYKVDIIFLPLEGTHLMALSYFDDQIIQDKLIDSLEREWRGVFFLQMIGNALLNIAKRQKISNKSFEKIMYMFEQPKGFNITIEKHSQISYVRKTLSPSIIEYNDKSILPKLFDLLVKEKSILSYWAIIDVLSKLITSSDIASLFKQLQDPSVSLNLKEKLILIITYSDLSLDFNDLFRILYGLSKDGFVLDKTALEDIPNYIETHPEIRFSYLFASTVKIFVECEDRIENLDVPKLLDFLTPYLDYPNQFVQETVLELFGLYKVDIILNRTGFVFYRSYLKLIEIISKYDLSKTLQSLKKQSTACLRSPDRFHSPILFQFVMTKLLELKFYKVAIDLFNEYFKSVTDFENFNCYTIKYISKFPKKEKFKVIETLMEVFLNLKDKKKGFSQLYSLFHMIPPIEDEYYYKICLKLMKLFGKNEDSSLIRLLSQQLAALKPIELESDILQMISDGAVKTQELGEIFYLLSLIGTENSIDSVKEYLSSSIDEVKQWAFICIRRIRRRQNIDWYNNEELFNSTQIMEDLEGN